MIELASLRRANHRLAQTQQVAIHGVLKAFKLLAQIEKVL
jgi:hypothetical protein